MRDFNILQREPGTCDGAIPHNRMAFFPIGCRTIFAPMKMDDEKHGGIATIANNVLTKTRRVRRG
jgi:hypothetical protein